MCKIDFLYKARRDARNVTAVIGLLVIGCHCPLSAHADSTTSSGEPGVVALTHEPAVLKTLVAARWRLASARAALPPVQLVHNEGLEIQDFIQYAFDGGALRLCVSPRPKGGDIFALLVDTRAPRYASFAHLTSTERYTTYHDGAYAVVIPLRPVTGKLFEQLKARRWTEGQLQRQLGATSYHWHLHGVGDVGLEYVPQGLSFIASYGDTYLVHVRGVDEDLDLASLDALPSANYRTLQTEVREGFANEAFRQRDEIDQALAIGTRSPDGHFVIGDVGLEGRSWSNEIVIKGTSKPERRYWAGGFDLDYRWLNARTVVFKIDRLALGEQFHTLNALTGVDKLVETVPYETVFNDDRVTDFGVSGSDRFWYKTADGQTHEVTVKGAESQAIH